MVAPENSIGTLRLLALWFVRAVKVLTFLTCIGFILTDVFYIIYSIRLPAILRTFKEESGTSVSPRENMEVRWVEKTHITGSFVGHILLSFMLLISSGDFAWFAQACGLIDTWPGRGLTMWYLSVESFTGSSRMHRLLSSYVPPLSGTHAAHVARPWLELSVYVLSGVSGFCGLTWFLLGVLNYRVYYDLDRHATPNPELALIHQLAEEELSHDYTAVRIDTTMNPALKSISTSRANEETLLTNGSEYSMGTSSGMQKEPLTSIADTTSVTGSASSAYSPSRKNASSPRPYVPEKDALGVAGTARSRGRRLSLTSAPPPRLSSNGNHSSALEAVSSSTGETHGTASTFSHVSSTTSPNKFAEYMTEEVVQLTQLAPSSNGKVDDGFVRRRKMYGDDDVA